MSDPQEAWTGVDGSLGAQSPKLWGYKCLFLRPASTRSQIGPPPHIGLQEPDAERQAKLHHRFR